MEPINELERHMDQLVIWLRSFQGIRIPISLKQRTKVIMEKILNGDEMSDDEWKAVAPKPPPPKPILSKGVKKKGKKKGQKKDKKRVPKNGLRTNKKYYNESREEKRLDGSPNSYYQREDGKYGSHPTHDNHREESKP